jgi:hypothetical protein
MNVDGRSINNNKQHDEVVAHRKNSIKQMTNVNLHSEDDEVLVSNSSNEKRMSQN